MRPTLPPRILRKIVIAALAALLAALVPAKQNDSPPPTNTTRPQRSKGQTSPTPSEKGASWQTIRNATLLENPWNDGDSFHILADGTHRVFRLYFVDTPETDRSLSDRIRTQAAFFHLRPEQIPALGERAAAFSSALLRGKPITVRTRWRDALGRSKLGRHYALIEVDGKDVGCLLVQNGLARTYGMKTDLPDGSDADRMVQKLHQLEREAKQKKSGAWALSALPLN